MTQILLIRHGETAWNVERRLQGQIDIVLNTEGERQAAALGRALAQESLDAIYSSDLRRTMQTAQGIAGPRRMAVLPERALRERCYGALEGLLHGEVEQRYPQAYAAWRARDPDSRFPDGERRAETLREFYRRAVDAVTSLAERHPHGKIALVTHGGVLECVYRAARAMDLEAPRDFDIRNAAINRLSWDGAGWQIAAWSETVHLEEASLDEIDK
ncbi:MAG: histidine phosphatase family protein [Noviherbaspirillum sp.]